MIILVQILWSELALITLCLKGAFTNTLTEIIFIQINDVLFQVVYGWLRSLLPIYFTTCGPSNLHSRAFSMHHVENIQCQFLGKDIVAFTSPPQPLPYSLTTACPLSSHDQNYNNVLT